LGGVTISATHGSQSLTLVDSKIVSNEEYYLLPEEPTSGTANVVSDFEAILPTVA
jgi:hypothetical protein